MACKGCIKRREYLRRKRREAYAAAQSVKAAFALKASTLIGKHDGSSGK